jgi:hypothetical protein
MLRKNLTLALLLFFGWLVLDSICSLMGKPLGGIYYPLASGRLKSVPVDWSVKTEFAAPLYFLLFASLWGFFVRFAGVVNGSRPAALISAFLTLPFWIVPTLAADLYDLEINKYWLVSMFYVNISFFLHGCVSKRLIYET